MATPATPVRAGDVLLEQGIRAVNFFNGRLLTGSDMGREQAARREADARLGQSIGAGIVQGLEVERDGPPELRRVRIRKGLAVSRAGQTLCLGADQVLALAPEADGTPPATTGGFGPCGVLTGGAYVAGNGLYLLALAPATVSEGKAPVLALDPGNVRCHTDAIVEAVQLRLLRIDEALLGDKGAHANASGDMAVSMLRSDVAAACFSHGALAELRRRPGRPAAPALLDDMRARGLTDCDVPLAVVYLTLSGGLVFVDRWSVRRRVAAPAATADWRAWVGGEPDALADARLAQFQEQLAELPASALPALVAADWLAWLPPAGFLDAEGPRQVDWQRFLGSRRPARSVPLAPGDLPGVLAQALHHDPVTLLPAAPTPRFRVYRVANGGPWLFVRDAPNVRHAEEVWLDGQRARLPGVDDVQAAIDALHARTCAQVSVWPGADVQARVDAVPAGSDLQLCFESGTYTLARPLRLRRLGRVAIHGGSGGALLHCETAECALLVEQCTSLSVSAVQLRSGRAGSGKGELDAGILGTLTALDTPEV